MAGGKGTSTDRLLGLIRSKGQAGKTGKAATAGGPVGAKASGKAANTVSAGRVAAPPHKEPAPAGKAAVSSVVAGKAESPSPQTQQAAGGADRSAAVSKKQVPPGPAVAPSQPDAPSPPNPPVQAEQPDKQSKPGKVAKDTQGKKFSLGLGKGKDKKQKEVVQGAETKKKGKKDGGSAVKKAAKKRMPFSFAQKTSGIVIGVDFGPESLRMAKVSNAGGRQKLLAYKRIPYDPAMMPGSADFVSFLRDKLREFVKGVRSPQIWSLVSSAKAELWHITIPKVPRRQIIEAVYWSVKKEKQFEESEYLLDFDVVGDITEKGVPKLAVTVCLVPRAQVDETANIFAKAGFKLHGLTIAPIALQTLFRSRWIQTDAGTCANLYVGRNWSRIDIFDKSNLVLSRGIKAGVNSMVESLVDNYNQQNASGDDGFSIDTSSGEAPVISMELDDALTLDLSDDGGPQLESSVQKMDLNQGKHVLFSKLLGTPKKVVGPGSELSDREVLDLVLPSIERLVRQIERTFEYHSTTMGNEPVEQVYFSSVICTNRLLLQYIYSQLGIESLILDPLHPDNPNMGRVASPESAVERLEYNLVVALALSVDAITPNFLFTYKDREKVKQSQLVDKLIYVATIFLLLVLAGVYMWQGTKITDASAELATLQRTLAAYQPKVTEEKLKKMAEQVHKQNLKMKMASLRYQSQGVLGEIFALTSKNISLLNIKMDLGPYEPLPQDEVATDKKKKKKASAKKKTDYNKLITVEGIIDGPDAEKFDDELTRYIIKLENSILFTVPIIDQNKVGPFGARSQVLHFVIHFNTP